MQRELFDLEGRPIVDAVLGGANGTILVYGQTGTGKTHTIFGSEGSNDGLCFRCVDALLDAVKGHCEEKALSMQVVEVYMERVTDMISQQDIKLFNGVPVQAAEAPLSSPADARTVLNKALKDRHVNATNMNERSSRSHVVVIIKLSSKDDADCFSSCNLVVVDLAGSECVGKTGAKGMVALEAGNINKSLSALKNCIDRLAQLSAVDPSQRPRIGFRDSKLTEMLQDSFGGTARTTLISCISTNLRDIDETRTTIEYTVKANKIRNTASTSKYRALEAENAKLKLQLALRADKDGVILHTKEQWENIEEQLGEKDYYKGVCAELEVEMRGLKSRQTIEASVVDSLKASIEEERAANVKLTDDFAMQVAALQNQLTETTALCEKALQCVVAEHREAVQKEVARTTHLQRRVTDDAAIEAVFVKATEETIAAMKQSAEHVAAKFAAKAEEYNREREAWEKKSRSDGGLRAFLVAAAAAVERGDQAIPVPSALPTLPPPQCPTLDTAYLGALVPHSSAFVGIKQSLSRFLCETVAVDETPTDAQDSVATTAQLFVKQIQGCNRAGVDALTTLSSNRCSTTSFAAASLASRSLVPPPRETIVAGPKSSGCLLPAAPKPSASMNASAEKTTASKATTGTAAKRNRSVTPQNEVAVKPVVPRTGSASRAAN
jgi:hypothetical protein